MIPQFFRHFVPKVVSKVFPSRIGKPLSKKDGSDPNPGKAVPRVKPSDPRFLRQTYLELLDWDRATTSSSTVITGGKKEKIDGSQKHGKDVWAESGECSDIEGEAANGQNLRTVRVESSRFEAS